VIRIHAVYFSVALALAPALAAQDADSHPRELTQTWSSVSQKSAVKKQTWAFIHFEPDGTYRAVRVEVGPHGAPQVGTVIKGRWAILRTEVRGRLLCARVDGADQSRCTPYQVAQSGAELSWNELVFSRADSLLVQRWALKGF
jgi:hypothetical protein